MLDMGVHPGLDAGYVPAAEPGLDTRGILEAAAAGELDALLIFGADAIADFPDAALARRALESGTFTVVAELFPTETALHADVVLPSAAYAEREGTFTNLERRLQKLEPLTQPPGVSREVWKMCRDIAGRLGDTWGWRTFEDIWTDIKANVPTHADVDVEAIRGEPMAPAPYDTTGFAPEEAISPLRVAGPGGQYPKGFRQGAPFQTGQNWPLSWELRAFEAKQRPGVIPGPVAAPGDPSSPTQPGAHPSSPPLIASDPGGSFASEGGGAPSFALLSGRMIYDEGTMVSKTAALRAIQRKPFVELNDEDAKELGVADGDEVVVEGAGTTVTLRAIVNGIVKGSVFVPFDQGDLRANTLMAGIDPRVTVRRA